LFDLLAFIFFAALPSLLWSAFSFFDALPIGATVVGMRGIRALGVAQLLQRERERERERERLMISGWQQLLQPIKITFCDWHMVKSCLAQRMINPYRKG
jgi:hypothetical protein